MGKWWRLCACFSWIAACGDEGDCTAEQKIAIQVYVTGIGHVDKVTGELDAEEECGSFRDANGDQVYTCWEQGPGVYTVRVYSGDEVHSKEIEVEAYKCHVKQRVESIIDLDAPPD